MSKVVFDASAVLAVLNDEPGGRQAIAFLPGAAISAVNLSEVVGKLAERGATEKDIRAVVERLGLKTYPFDRATAWRVGLMKPTTQPVGLSMGDRACIALGSVLSAPVVTADRAWKNLSLGVEIRVLR